ncbi:hypothetical protein EBU24_01640 [bacterium]|nr:hypothetical protein [bacterium]
MVSFTSKNLAQENNIQPSCLNSLVIQNDAINLTLQASALWLLSLAKTEVHNFFEKDSSMRSRNDYYNLLANSGLYCSCLGLCFSHPCTECFMCAGCVCASTALIIRQPERTDFYHAHE